MFYPPEHEKSVENVGVNRKLTFGFLMYIVYILFVIIQNSFLIILLERSCGDRSNETSYEWNGHISLFIYLFWILGETNFDWGVKEKVPSADFRKSVTLARGCQSSGGDMMIFGTRKISDKHGNFCRRMSAAIISFLDVGW